MRKVLLGLATSASLMLGAGTAVADGMSRSSIKDVGCTAVFQGFYVGAHGGYTQYTAHQNDQSGFLTDNSGWTATDNSFTGGVQAGYNWQRGCNTLFGIEADWSYGNLDATTIDEPGPDFGSMRTSLKNYGTLRTRTGLIMDNLLLYVTGGLAFATIDFSAQDAGVAFSAGDTRWGWTTGVGTEWAWRPNVTFKSEVLYMNFGDNKHSFTNEGTTSSFTTQDSLWVTRAGVNFKF